MDLYHKAIVDTARAATGAGKLEDADASVTLDNPLCGDRVSFDVRLRDGEIDAVAHRVRGCLLCEAAASIIGDAAPGGSVEQLNTITTTLTAWLKGESLDVDERWQSLEIFEPARAYKSRHECVLLPFEAMERTVVKALTPAESPEHKIDP